METIIQRLRFEKAETERDYHEKGWLEGSEWAKAASYLDLYCASKLVLTDDHGHYHLQRLFQHEVLGDFFFKSICSDAAMAPEEGDELLNDFATEWLAGWCEAVDGFHTEVVKKL